MNKLAGSGIERLWPPRILGLFFALYDLCINMLTSVLLLGLRVGSPKEIRRIEKYIEKVYGIPRRSHFSDGFVYNCFRHQIAILIEVLSIAFGWPWAKWRGEQSFHATIKSLRQAGGGYLVCTAHYGSWDLVGHQASLNGGGAFYALAKPADFNWATKLMTFFRGHLGVSCLWTDRPTLFRSMIKVLRHNDGLGFVMDQKPPSRDGPMVDFFGIKTQFVAGPATLALKEKAPIICAFCERLGPFSYKVSHEIVYDGKSELSMEALTQKLANKLEAAIRQHPEQWLWNYRRWSDSELSGEAK